jgi:hypothetical protein
MSRLLFASILLLTGACAAAPDGQERPIGVAGVVGTPLLFAFKIPACAVTVGVAASAAGATALATQDDDERMLRQALEDGVRQNCGPPYLAGP